MQCTQRLWAGCTVPGLKHRRPAGAAVRGSPVGFAQGVVHRQHVLGGVGAAHALHCTKKHAWEAISG